MAGEAWAMSEDDLAATLESDFAAPITLIDPDGNIINYSAHGGPLLGKIQYDYARVQPTGEAVVIHEPIVVLRRSSLSRIPKAGENWLIPDLPGPHGESLGAFSLGVSRAPEGSETIGYIKFFPTKAGQA